MSGMALVLLGGNAGQALLAEVARDMGFRTILFDRAESPPAAAVVDRFERIDIARADLIVPRVAALAEEYDIRACSGVADYAFGIIGEIYDRLGIFQRDAGATYARAVDKALCRRALTAAGVRVPTGFASVDVGSPAELAGRVDSELRFPVVVKPVVGHASRGVSIVPDATAFSPPAPGGGGIVVEEVVAGRHFNVDGIVIDGDYEGTMIAERFFGRTLPTQCEVSVHPAEIPTAETEALFEVAARAVAALGIENGPITVDLIVDRDGRAFVIEVSPHFHNPVSTAAIGGNGAFRAWLSGLAGDAGWRRHVADRFDGVSGLWRLYAPAEGTVAGYADDLGDVGGMARSIRVDIRRRPGERVERTAERGELCALVWVHADDHRRLDEALDRVRSNMRVNVIAGPASERPASERMANP